MYTRGSIIFYLYSIKHYITVVDAHSCDEEKGLLSTMALEPEPGEKGTGCLAALYHAEKEKEGEIQPSHGKIQEKADHYWSEAVDKGISLSMTRTYTADKPCSQTTPSFPILHAEKKLGVACMETRRTIRFIAS